jgi:hypothetical protein
MSAKSKKRGSRNHRNVANPEMYRAMLGKRFSSAASPHADSRTQRVRTRSAARSAAVRDFS